ncbi:hypothetical protein OJF2_76690 [Aquisphaera giovannonii]|uniref:Uncharacterized protein n=1 Tax=Aquisphaera giovannonii TaxID=406548 RepID=A0A5B9WET5_9BACT|nr:hypothetical protein [Aquisphaera giovannonii]QEH39057.1 hypothetical protein OJF2_76690 [Aquisphaera giovannonii]
MGIAVGQRQAGTAEGKGTSKRGERVDADPSPLVLLAWGLTYLDAVLVANQAWLRSFALRCRAIREPGRPKK